MISSGKIKSVDFYRKIPRDLTEASLSGAGLSIVAALTIMFLFGMELSNYFSPSTSTSIVVDKSSDSDFLRIEFNISFPALSCEFASLDVSDALGTNRLNITKTVSRFSIDHDLKPVGSEFHSGSISHAVKHGDKNDEEFYSDSSMVLIGRSFEKYAHLYPVLVVNFYAPWCYWSNRLKPSWEKAAKIIKERYDPEFDGRILMAKVDCSEEVDLCKRHHIQGYPSIRIFRKGSDVRGDHGHHEHESYYGDRDTDSLVLTMEGLVAPIQLESKPVFGGNATNNPKRPAPLAGGCRIEGFVRVKKVPGDLVVSARSESHSFDSSEMNMSHVVYGFSFGREVSDKLVKEVRRLIPDFAGSRDRLAGNSYINHRDIRANVTIEHYMQIVKTEVMMRGRGKVVEQYEYTAHSSLAESVYIPVAKFHFEPSPMQVLIFEISKPFSHFLTNLCAIIGGVFTVAGILDSLFHNTLRIMHKVELGKNF